MTSKDYDLIAACIGHNIHIDKDDKYDIDGKRLVASLLNKLKLDNPRFNESEFIDRINYWRNIHMGNKLKYNIWKCQDCKTESEHSPQFRDLWNNFKRIYCEYCERLTKQDLIKRVEK